MPMAASRLYAAACLEVGTVDGYEQTARCMSEQDKPRPPLPPFDATTAAQKVRMAEAGWKI